MKKNILAMCMLGLFMSANAQNPKSNILRIYTNDGEVIDDKAIEEPYKMDFFGNPGVIIYRKNGIPVACEEENTDIYAIVNPFKEYTEPITVNIAVTPRIRDCEEVGFLISTNHITGYEGTKLNAVSNSLPNNNNPVFGTIYEEDVKYYNLKDIKDGKVMYCPSNCYMSNYYKATINLYNPALCTTYYIRPYAKFNSECIMFGSEKEITTTKTMYGFLNEYNYTLSCQGLIVTDDAIKEFCNAHDELNVIKEDKEAINLISNYLSLYLDETDCNPEVFDSNIKIEECVDGSIKFVEKLPNTISEGYWNSLNEQIDIHPVYNLYRGVDKLDHSYTQNINLAENWQMIIDSFKECPDSLDVPGGGYYSFDLLKQGFTTMLTYNIPKYVMPIEYDIYAVIVNTGDTLTNSFRVGIYNRDAQKYTDYKGLYPNDNDDYFVGNKNIPCETIHLGRHKFDGGKNRILLQPKRRYKINLSKIYLVPVKNEEKK